MARCTHLRHRPSLLWPTLTSRFPKSLQHLLPNLRLCHLSPLSQCGVLNPSCLPSFLVLTPSRSQVRINEDRRVDTHYSSQPPQAAGRKERGQVVAGSLTPGSKPATCSAPLLLRESIPSPAARLLPLICFPQRKCQWAEKCQKSAGTPRGEGAFRSSPAMGSRKEKKRNKSSWNVDGRGGQDPNKTPKPKVLAKLFLKIQGVKCNSQHRAGKLHNPYSNVVNLRI